MIRGKNVKAVVDDIAEGYVSVNPLFLKPLTVEILSELHQGILKAQTVVRSVGFPQGDMPAIRKRNLRLQRLMTAVTVIKNYARERRLKLA